jgi:hypothetical protein
MSIDVPSAQMNTSSLQDFNYIDSYVEYVAEVILKHENAIPESKHRQQKELQLHKHIQVICQALPMPAIDAIHYNIRKVYGNYSAKYVTGFIKEINPPPPKASS